MSFKDFNDNDRPGSYAPIYKLAQFMSKVVTTERKANAGQFYAKIDNEFVAQDAFTRVRIMEVTKRRVHAQGDKVVCQSDDSHVPREPVFADKCQDCKVKDIKGLEGCQFIYNVVIKFEDETTANVQFSGASCFAVRSFYDLCVQDQQPSEAYLVDIISEFKHSKKGNHPYYQATIKVVEAPVDEDSVPF